MSGCAVVILPLASFSSARVVVSKVQTAVALLGTVIFNSVSLAAIDVDEKPRNWTFARACL